jgi:hypothetical protein
LHATHLQCIGTSATLAGAGSLEQQRAEVAGVASVIFGDTIHPENVIGETLRRASTERSLSQKEAIEELKASIQNLQLPHTHADFIHHPLASWVESSLGLATDSVSGRLIRAHPKSLTGEEGAGRELSRLTGLPEAECVEALQAILLKGYEITNPDTNFPAFAFRLHQFISRGDTVYASIEAESPFSDKSMCPVTARRSCCPWLSAGSAARNITLCGVQHSRMGARPFCPGNSTKTAMRTAANPVSCISTRKTPGRMTPMTPSIVFRMIGSKKRTATWSSRKASVKTCLELCGSQPTERKAKPAKDSLISKRLSAFVRTAVSLTARASPLILPN